MKTAVSRFALVATLSTLALHSASGQGFLKKLFNGNPDRMPNASELQSREAAAQKLFDKAQSMASAGKEKKAISLYRKTAFNYPLTQTAARAQFRVGELYERQGKISSAFDAYQEFIDSYKNSPQFSDALQRQFDIASNAKDGAKVRSLGIKRRFDPSRIIEMYEAIISNAPRNELASKSQLAIGQVYEKKNDYVGAVSAYQQVVDNYSASSIAADAQMAIAKIGISEIEGGTQDAGSIRTTQAAAADVILIDPEGENRQTALDILEQLDETSAAKSYEIGRFYEKQGNFKAAAIYYEEVVQVPESEFYGDARERLGDIAAAEPEAIRKADDVGGDRRIARNDLIVPAEQDIVSRNDYVGPPPPPSRRLRKTKLRTTPPSQNAPLFPVTEPPLPSEPSIDFKKPIDGRDLLLPPPPPPPPPAQETVEPPVE